MQKTFCSLPVHSFNNTGRPTHIIMSRLNLGRNIRTVSQFIILVDSFFWYSRWFAKLDRHTYCRLQLFNPILEILLLVVVPLMMVVGYGFLTTFLRSRESSIYRELFFPLSLCFICVHVCEWLEKLDLTVEVFFLANV